MGGNAPDVAKLLLRVQVGLLVLVHGTMKVLYGNDFVSGVVAKHGLPHVVSFGVYFGEVLGPLLLISGFYSRIGAGLIVANMFIDICLVHLGQFEQMTSFGGWALELQSLFLLVPVVTILLGPGKYALNPR
jgi:putative oxidoreductase